MDRAALALEPFSGEGVAFTDIAIDTTLAFVATPHLYQQLASSKRYKNMWFCVIKYDAIIVLKIANDNHNRDQITLCPNNSSFIRQSVL